MLTAPFDSRSASQIAKFAARVPSFPRRPIRKSIRPTFCSRRLSYPQICAPSFWFQPAFDPQFASLICGSPHYPTLYRCAPLRFFSLFFASLRTHLRFFPALALRFNSVASLAQSVAAMSGHAPRRRIFARFLRAVARGYFQNFTQNSKTACTYIRAAVINARF